MKTTTSWRTRIGALLGKQAAQGEAHPQFLHYQGLGEIEPVFKCAGVQYYRFSNEQRVPALRAFASKDVYNELTWRTTSEHLRATIKATVKLMDQGKYTQAGVLLDTLDQRLDYITHVDLLYKLASVLYFDQSENVLDWDPVYAGKKMYSWQSEASVDAFFLQTPMIDLLPFGDISKIDLQAFTTALRKADLSHLTTVSRILSPGTENSELNTYLTSQMEILQSLIP